MQMYLYRHFDQNGRLLYIGITNDLKRRNMHHAENSPWAHLIASTKVDHFDNRFAASKAEADAIAKEHPKHNKAMKKLPPHYTKCRGYGQGEYKPITAMGVGDSYYWPGLMENEESLGVISNYEKETGKQFRTWSADVHRPTREIGLCVMRLA